MSPTQIKPKVISLINNEANYGTEGRIIVKMNSLVDPDVIQTHRTSSRLFKSILSPVVFVV